MKDCVKIGLRPYSGVLYAVSSKEAYIRYFGMLFGAHPVVPEDARGLFTKRSNLRKEWTCLVYAETPWSMAHELSHAVISLFDRVGIPINPANDEAFCYMLSQLMSDTKSLYETRRNKGVRK